MNLTYDDVENFKKQVNELYKAVKNQTIDLFNAKIDAETLYMTITCFNFSIFLSEQELINIKTQIITLIKQIEKELEIQAKEEYFIANNKEI